MEEIAGLARTDTFESSTSTLEQAGLDRDAFLKIFLTQLEYQDPLNPQDSAELSAQLATFSELEQSVIQVGQLREINEHLEELIEASTRAQAPTTLDPVSLIGKRIEVKVDEIFVPGLGESIELGFDLEQSGLEFLNFLALDASGAPLGLGSVSAQAGNPPSSTFAPGHYALVFQNGAPQLRAPGQDPLDTSPGDRMIGFGVGREDLGGQRPGLFVLVQRDVQGLEVLHAADFPEEGADPPESRFVPATGGDDQPVAQDLAVALFGKLEVLVEPGAVGLRKGPRHGLQEELPVLGRPGADLIDPGPCAVAPAPAQTLQHFKSFGREHRRIVRQAGLVDPL